MAEPFVKWAGGKRQLLEEIHARLPKDLDEHKYYEPFVGGGALLFNLEHSNAVINDMNWALINVYRQLQGDMGVIVMSLLDMMDDDLRARGKEYYYEVRTRFNQGLSEHDETTPMAAMFIFLNKHCFNGLYRVNRKGEFNVPYNNSTASSHDPDNMLKILKFLKSVEIRQGDFEDACRDCTAGDFVFFDSPYAPLKDDSFDSYTKEGFPKEDHERLASLFRRLADRGVRCMLTNHDTPFIRDLYKDFKIETVNVKRSINRNASGRTGTELIVTSYLT